MKKTIIIVAPYFPPHGGGLERYAYEIGKRLDKDYQWRVVVITSGERRGEDMRESLGDDITVYRLGYRWKISNTPFSFVWLSKLRRILKEENPDIINIHAPVPGIGDLAALVSNGKPMVVTYHAGSMHKKKSWLNLFIWLYEHGPLYHLLGKADRIICSSDFVRIKFLGKYLYKSTTITPGVDCDLFKPNPDKKTKIHTVLFVAGLGYGDQHKGLKILLDAIKIAKEAISDVKLIVVGEGEMKDIYRQYAGELGLSDAVDFQGRLTGDKLVEAYQRANVFVLPSLNESLGMVILKAMACELPVVSTVVGGIPLTVEDGKSGFLLDTYTPSAFAEKICELFHDPARAAAFGASGRLKIMKEFDWHKLAASYNQILVQTLGDGVPHIPRISVVASYFYPKIGGLENYAYLLAKQLHESEKYKMSIITSNYDGDGYRQDIIDGMTVHRLPVWFKISNTPINLLWYWQIKKILTAEQSDVVHLHSPVPFMSDVAAFAAKDRPVLLTYHSGSMLKGKWPADAIIRLYENIFLPALFRRAAAIVAISQQFAKRNFPQFMDKTYFIPTGVDLNRFRKTPLPQSTELITFVGRIEHSSSWKGIEQLLQAMALVIKKRSQAKLELVGGGDAVEYYRRRAQELGIGPAVIFSGPLLGEELVKAYQRCSMIVLPSTSDSEAFSIALIEAQASGRPIIGTNIGGTPQVIDDGKNGLLVPPKDPEALAEAIKKLLGNIKLATRLADCGAAKAQGFAWEIQAAKYAELFKKILSEKSE